MSKTLTDPESDPTKEVEVSRGARRLAQIPDEDAAKVVVPFRATLEQRRAIDEAVAEEARAKTREGKKAPTLSKVVGYLMDQGLDLYWVRHELGKAMDAAAEPGWDRRKTLLELVKRGLSRGKK
jgi:hypothetical protein